MSRSDVQKMQEQIQQMEQAQQREMAQLREQLQRLQNARDSQPAARGVDDYDERISELEDELEEVRDIAEFAKPGQTRFLMSGYASATYTDRERTNSSFSAQFNPIFNWRLTDKVFFSGELEFELDSSSTAANLEYAYLGYIVNDYLTIVGGKFLTPLSSFKEHLHAPWINKLPDQPLFAGGSARLIPTSSLGFMARGAIPIGSAKLTYSAYVSNGFALRTTGAGAGTLSFSNFSDVNSNKSFGGRVGIFVIPELEFAYAFNYGDSSPDASGFPELTALVHDLSVAYVAQLAPIKGQVDVRGEVILSRVDAANFGAGVVNNDREGGYVQVAYRPTMVDSMLKDFEAVFRWDFLDNPVMAATPFDEDRFTFGLNYWVSPSAVFKIAYQIDNVSDPSNSRPELDTVLFQFAMGF